MRKVLSLSDTSDRFDASSSITPIAAEALPYPRSWSRCAEYKLLISFLFVFYPLRELEFAVPEHKRAPRAPMATDTMGPPQRD